MKNASGTAVWMVGALLISLLIAAGAYTLLISPELEKASTAMSELESVQEFNSLLDTQILGAQSAAKDVDDWYAQIAAIRVDLPPTPEQSAFQRFVDDSLRKEGLPTVAVTFGTPAEVAPAISDPSAAVVPEPADATVPEDGASDETTAPADPAADPVTPDDSDAVVSDPPLVTGLLETPVTITTEGQPLPIMRFLLDMQTQNTRFFTVTNFDIQRADAADPQAARPPLVEGDWVITITGLVFNLFDPELSLPIEEPATTPPYTGDSVPNPFAPIPGTETVATP